MTETLKEEEISHPLNEPLLKEATEVKEEHRLLKERLQKLDQTRDGVSAAVYQKVRTDYVSKINQTMERILTLKKALEQEQKILLEKKGLVEAHLKKRRESIEESELRFSLGEFTEEKRREIRHQEGAEINQLEAALQTLNEGLEKHLALFAGEAFAQELPTKPEKIRPPAAAPAPPPMEMTSRIQTPDTGTRVPELLVMEGGKVTQTLLLDRTLHIGRSPSNDIVLKEPKVSRQHAEIQCVGGKYVILDLESSNGTYVGGKKVAEQALQPGDEIVIGNTKMVFKI